MKYIMYYDRGVITFAESQGRPLIKINCLSVLLLPWPWAHLDTKPSILSKNPQKISSLNIHVRKEHKRIFFEFLKNNSPACGTVFVNHDISERIRMIIKKKYFEEDDTLNLELTLINLTICIGMKVLEWLSKSLQG